MFNAMKLGTIEISTMKMKVNNVTCNFKLDFVTLWWWWW